MPVYIVKKKSDGTEVHRYAAAAVTEGAYPLADFDHAELVEGAEPSPAVPTKVTKRAFWNRFPSVKETAMRAVMLQGSPVLLAAGLERLRARVDSSPFVDLQLSETVLGVGWLASEQVPLVITVDGVTLPLRLTAEEASAVLTAPPSEAEVFNG